MYQYIFNALKSLSLLHLLFHAIVALHWSLRQQNFADTNVALDVRSLLAAKTTTSATFYVS